MQLSLFDTLNYYKDWVIDDPNVSWKPSGLENTDVLYYKNKPMLHIYIRKSDVHDAWHFQTTSMPKTFGTGFLTTDVSMSLNETIEEWKRKGSWG